ncbi:hypothetical protein ACFWDI_40560 [Streptomyces sp. NPDC060064]|uniref:hypothetical protein n=1 Tax=Streptomyces sp. NPDC060064 TaxID=3347049 RepID=UPI003692276D
MRSDRRDRRTVFFQDPADAEVWHVLRWNGLPPADEVPAFSSATADALLAQARGRGISPHSDADLLPVLLELLGGAAPVEQWPTAMSKGKRAQHARRSAQAAAARADRPADRAESRPKPSRPPGEDGEVVPLQWPRQARQADEAVRADMRRRREAAVSSRPKPPPRLSQALRSRSLFALLDDESDDQRAPAGPGGGDSA